MAQKNESLILIDTYFKTFVDVIDARHINTHRGIYNDSGQDEIELEYGFGLYEASRLLKYDLDDKLKNIFPEVLIDSKIKEFRKDRLKMITKVEENVNTLLRLFLTSLKSEFLRNLHKV